MEPACGHYADRHQHCPLENISAAFQSLDTVRALHQTVISLRSALEDAHKEIDDLKKQILIKGDIDEGKVYRQRVDKVDSTEKTGNKSTNSVRFEDDRPIEVAATKKENEIKAVETDSLLHKPVIKSPRKKLKSSSRKGKYDVNKAKNELSSKLSSLIVPDIRILTDPQKFDKTRKQMASKIDVKIKVSSNIKVDANSSDATTTDTNSGSETPQESESHNELNSGEATAKNSETVNVQYTSQENIKINTNDKTVVRKSTENINIESESDDNPSLVSIEVDDDVEEKSAIKRPAAIEAVAAEQSSPIDEEISNQETENPKITRSSTSENHEEVDDIELIFSADDKDFAQEDLVSISDYEPWEKTGTSGTPVLVNFSAIASDQETLDRKSKKKKMDEDVENAEGSFYNAVQQANLNKGHSLESNDSFSDPNKGSFERETSMDNKDDINIRRDESFDTFDQIGNASALGRRWTNYNVFIETDISKCGIAEESILEMGRRNTCPNPPAYRPIMHREAMAQNRYTSATATRCPLAVKFSRNSRSQNYPSSRSPRPILQDSTNKGGPKRSSSAQTEISALPEHWRSESHLAGGRYGEGFYTLPSKFIPPPGSVYRKYPLQISDKSQEARRVLLSDINFTSMVPELSRSADHLCQEDGESNGNDTTNDKELSTKGYYKGQHLKTPDYSTKGITPSTSLTSPGVSQWTVNENSFGTQTTQTDNNYYCYRGDSFDSSKSFSMGSRYSNVLDKSHRSRSVPSVRCAICRQNHGFGGIRTSESMNYNPRVTFQEPLNQSVRGSLPDLRHECTCPHRRYMSRSSMLRMHGYSSGSTESLLDEADDFLRKSTDGIDESYGGGSGKKMSTSSSSNNNRRCSENDIKRDFSPSKQSLPFLPKTPKCLKPGHLAKVITKNGRVVVGRVRYIGPLVSSAETSAIAGFTAADDDPNFVGLQLPNKIGDCDGTIDGRKFFDCEPQHGIFVPFKKIVMAWKA